MKQSSVIIEQDNTSPIQLERNRWKLGSKRIKHINVRYFLITGLTDSKQGMLVELSKSQQGDMESDYPTKGLLEMKLSCG